MREHREVNTSQPTPINQQPTINHHHNKNKNHQVPTTDTTINLSIILMLIPVQLKVIPLVMLLLITEQSCRTQVSMILSIKSNLTKARIRNRKLLLCILRVILSRWRRSKYSISIRDRVLQDIVLHRMCSITDLELMIIAPNYSYYWVNRLKQVIFIKSIICSIYLN